MSPSGAPHRVAELAPGIVGISAAMREVVELATASAPSALPVLILGATGTGKELVARLVHERSGRPGGLIAVNCASIPEHLAEAELFGAGKGAYTGAGTARDGLYRAADGGTLFLDELCSLPLAVQGKLLRAIESGVVRRLGETKDFRVQVRIVTAAQDATTSDVLPTIRRDLLHRLAGMVLRVPPLAARSEDVWPLARHFAAEHGVELVQEARAFLEASSWPGNVRELRRTVERAVVLARHAGILALDDVQRAAASGLNGEHRCQPDPKADQGNGVRRELLATARDVGAHPTALADALGISRATLFRRLASCGLSVRELRRVTHAKL